ncbi:MAG: PKD domain-containing protein [Pseudomonadota bacterium]
MNRNILATLLLLVFSASTHAAVCDADFDSDVDRKDIGAILKSRRLHVDAGDPRDANFNGIVTIVDAFICLRRCTLRRCAAIDPMTNTAPTASAGEDVTASLFEDVLLDGSASTDPDGDPISYQWSLVESPDGSTAALIGAGNAMPIITPDVTGEYVIELVVNDGQIDSAPDRVSVFADAPVFVIDDSIASTGTVSAEGGEIVLDDGSGNRFTLSIPAGALAEDTEIRLSRLASASALPPGTQLLAGVGLSPEGTEFAEAALLTIELPPSTRTGLPAIASVSNDDGSEFTLATLEGADVRAAALTDATVVVRIPHFTVGAVIEAGINAALPPPPEVSSAEERNRHKIAVRVAEIFSIPVEQDPPSIIDDPTIVAALEDWLDNPIDGIASRARDLAINPMLDDLSTLQTTLRDLRNLAIYSNGFLDDNLNPRGSFFDFEDRVTAAAAELVASYTADAKDLCDTDSVGAKDILDELLLFVSIPRWYNEDLSDQFTDETFECAFTFTLTPASQQVFVGETAAVEYSVFRQDGTQVEDGVGVELTVFTPGELTNLDTDTYGLITVVVSTAGTFQVSVVVNGVTQSAEITGVFAPPNAFNVTYSGSEVCTKSGGDGINGSFTLPASSPAINEFGDASYTIPFSQDGATALFAIDIFGDGGATASGTGSGSDSYTEGVLVGDMTIECSCQENSVGSGSGSGSNNPATGVVTIGFNWSVDTTITCTGGAACSTLNETCVASGTATFTGQPLIVVP